MYSNLIGGSWNKVLVLYLYDDGVPVVGELWRICDHRTVKGRARGLTFWGAGLRNVCSYGRYGAGGGGCRQGLGEAWSRCTWWGGTLLPPLNNCIRAVGVVQVAAANQNERCGTYFTGGATGAPHAYYAASVGLAKVFCIKTALAAEGHGLPENKEVE